MRAQLILSVLSVMLLAARAEAQNVVPRTGGGGSTAGQAGAAVGGGGLSGGGAGQQTMPGTSLTPSLPVPSAPPVVKPAQPALAAPSPAQVVPPRPPRAGAPDGGDSDGCECWRNEVVTFRQPDGRVGTSTELKKTGQRSQSCCPR